MLGKAPLPAEFSPVTALVCSKSLPKSLLVFRSVWNGTHSLSEILTSEMLRMTELY